MSRECAKLTCDNCGYEEFPVRHTYHSSCGGLVVVEDGGSFVCDDCGSSIYEFICDKCRTEQDEDAVDTDDYYGND